MSDDDDTETKWFGPPDHPGRAGLPLAEEPPPVEEPSVLPMNVKPNTRTVINMQRDRRTIS